MATARTAATAILVARNISRFYRIATPRLTTASRRCAQSCRAIAGAATRASSLRKVGRRGMITRRPADRSKKVNAPFTNHLQAHVVDEGDVGAFDGQGRVAGKCLMGKSSVAKAFYQWTRDFHLYFGLFVSPFVIAFAISVFFLNHAKVDTSVPTSVATFHDV